MAKHIRLDDASVNTPKVGRYVAIAQEMQVREKFIERTDFAVDGGCWEWQGGIDSKGYGLYFSPAYGKVLAHRLAMHLAGRPVPQNLTVDHLCRNRRCVNTAHLEAVTSAVNTLRGNTVGGINARKTHCNWGHEFTPENTYIGKARTDIGTPTRTCKACTKVRNARQRKLAA